MILKASTRQKQQLSILNILECGGNSHPFTSDKLSSNLAFSVWLGILLRPSANLSKTCSTLLQDPVEE